MRYNYLWIAFLVRLLRKKTSINHPTIKCPYPLSHLLYCRLLFGILYTALPETITVGPDWLPLIIEVIIIAPIVIARIVRHPIPSLHTSNNTYFTLCDYLALIISIVLLIVTLPRRQATQASGLLRTGALPTLATS